MSEEFQLFISSTVNDLAPVREELARNLAYPGCVIRYSEDARFPVEPGTSAHDACLAVVRRSHGFILLIGSRFGAEYLDQGKSITWREWEEARGAGLTPIVLINRKTTDVCRLIAEERSALLANNPTASAQELDSLLEDKLGEILQGYHLAPSIQRFVDRVCTEYRDNWVKLDWDGSAGQALEYIRFNLFIQAAASDRRRRDTIEYAQAAGVMLGHVRDLGLRVVGLTADARCGKITHYDAVQGMLETVALLRAGLFGFEDRDRYTLIVHELHDSALHPIARVAHPRVPRRGRKWMSGQGHAGQAILQDQFMVSGDIRQTFAWVRNPATDEEDQQNYVSMLSRPYYDSYGKPIGVVTLTSSRLDHFTKVNDSAAQAFETVVSLINSLVLETQHERRRQH